MLLLCLLCIVRTATAQTPLTIQPNGANPMVLECGVQTYRELGATVRGGVQPYGRIVIAGSVDSHEPGTYRITYSVRDASGATATASRTVITRDTIAPAVSVGTALSLLWSPNHTLRDVGFGWRIWDACDESPRVLVRVFADEDDEEQTGDGRHSPDAKTNSQNGLRLRAERKGNSDGRVYLIVMTATDHSGNVGWDSVSVVVPHSQSKKALDSIRVQAASAESRTEEFARYMVGKGVLPSGFYLVGDGPILGRSQ